MTHRILPSTGHEVACATRVCPKRSYQSFWLSPRPQQGQERIPDPDLQREQRITHLVRQDSRGLGQERPQGCRMRHVPLPRGNWPIRSVGWVSCLRGLDCPHRSAGRVAQQELGDTTGLTNVHVNRVLQSLRRDGLITLKGKNLVILEVERLNAFSGFTPNYLHLVQGNGVKERSL